MDKLKKFFQNKVVMIIESILLIASAAGLTIGGVSASDINKLADFGLAGIALIDGIVTFIAAIISGKKAVTDGTKG